MKPVRIVLFLFVCASCFGATAWSPAPAHAGITASLFYPWATNTDPAEPTNVRLSLLYTETGKVKGLDLGLGVARTRGDQSGLQLNLLYSRIDGQLSGVSGTVGAAYVAEGGSGVLAAGLATVVSKKFRGLMLAGFLNYAQDEVHGVQWAWGLNHIEAEGSGLQYAFIANQSGGNYRGAQLSTLANVTAMEIKGAQVGAANMALRVRGFQLGLLNIAGEVHGLQIGIYNRSGSHDGVPIGLYNDSTNGDVDWVSYASNLSLFNTGVRTRVNNFHSIVSMGTGDARDSDVSTLFFSWHYGYTRPVKNSRVGGDLGFVHIAPQERGVPLGFAIQARGLWEFRFSPTVSGFVGAGASFIYSEYKSGATSEVDPLVVAGISLF